MGYELYEDVRGFKYLGSVLYKCELLEEVREFKYLGLVRCKHCTMEGKINERAVEERKAIGSLGRIMNGKKYDHEY